MKETQGTENKSVRFSVLVPVYNAEKYLSECIESVLNQSFQDYELVLVNDGSTDRSGEIIDEYAAKYPFIKVYHKENGGQLHTRKYAVDHAEGEFCVFLDSDDYLAKNAMERIDSALREYSCECVIYGMDTVRDGKTLSYMRDPEDSFLVDKRSLYRKCFFSMDYNSMCRKAVRRDILNDLDYSSYYHIQHGEDLLQTVEVFQRIHGVAFISDVLYHYRMNPQSMTHNIQLKKFNADNTVRERVLSFLQSENAFTDQDFCDYRGICIRVLAIKLRILSGFEIDLKEKKAFFDQIKRSDYYQGFLNAGKYDFLKVGKNVLFYWLFQLGLYRTLVAFANVSDLKLKKSK